MTETCHTCCHWARRRIEDAFEFDPEEEAAAKPAYEQWGTCRLTAMKDGRPVIATTKAWAQDGEQYKASLLTHETFGCVQWEAGDALKDQA